MSESCNHDCSSCSANCGSRTKESMIFKTHKDSKIRKVIGVVSGKGGVGKSMISSMLATNFQRKGYRENLFFRARKRQLRARLYLQRQLSGQGLRL